MEHIFIAHFRPLEKYPPAQNLIKYFEGEGVKVSCVSTKGDMKPMKFTSSSNIFRLGNIDSSKLMLWISYLYFNLVSILLLIVKRPRNVMYYESLSAFPVVFYKRYINKACRLYIHYHEYTTLEEYQKASFVERYFHKVEKKVFTKANWISHTNDIRLSMFLNDFALERNDEVHRVMPNYPSQSWGRANVKWNGKESIKMIYVGYSLTKKGSYILELLDLLKQLDYQIELNIYCIKTNSFLDQLPKSEANVKMRIESALSYSDLPEVISQHHVGLILYKGLIPNAVHIAPNKLFEYLACGLDVWYSKEILGIHEYDSDLSPKVICLNFKNLGLIDKKRLLPNENKTKKVCYFAENIYINLLNKLKAL